MSERERGRRWRRRALLASLYVLLGAAASLAVAVGCAMLSRTQWVQLRPFPETPRLLMTYGRPEGWQWNEDRGPGLRERNATFYLVLRPGEATPTHGEFARAGAPWWLKLPDRPVRLRAADLDEYFRALDAKWNESWHESNRVYSETFDYLATGAGWPLVCLSATWLPDADKPEERLHGGALYEWRWPRRATARVIPLAPCWPGLAANAVLYGAAFGLVVQGPGCWRAARRRRRGLCVKCGYDLSGARPGAGCPECGRGRRGIRGAD